MEKSAFAFVRKFGMKQVIFILLIMLPMFGLQILMYQLPKVIIDDAIGGGEGPRQLLGMELARLDFLWILCGSFLLLVLIIGLIKFIVQTLKGILAERLLRRLRYQLLERTLRFPPEHFQKTSQSEIVTMVTAETEPLSSFFGESYIQPVFQGGIFLVVLLFLFSQNIVLGIVASMSMPIQAWIVPRLQRRIRMLGKQRVKAVRELSERIGETVSGVSDLHTNDGIRYVQADFSGRLGKIFNIRFEIHRRKFFMKFINNFINQLTPFFFYSIGGYLVIKGQLSLGALTAGLVAYKDLAAPWKELLTWYQLQADATVKYDTLTEQFQPAGMIPPERLQGVPGLPDWTGQSLSLGNLSWAQHEDWKPVNNVSHVFKPGEATLITGASTGGKHELAALLSGIQQPDSGKIQIGDDELTQAHRSVTGGLIGYINHESAIFSGTLYDNLVLGLQRYPHTVADTAFEREALASGNSQLAPDADWLHLEAIGLKTEAQLQQHFLDISHLLNLGDTFYDMGMQSIIDPQAHPELASGILMARQALAQRLQQEGNEDLIQRFEPECFNRYASIAENVVYGQPTDQTFAFHRLGKNEYVRSLLEAQGLKQNFLDMGIRLAQLLVDLFKDSGSGDYFFEQFSFINADSLPELADIIRRYEREGEAALSQADKNHLRSLPFHLIPQRHRLNLISAEMEEHLITLRHAFRANLPPELATKVTFFEQDAYNPGLTVQANILFGRIAHGRTRTGAYISQLMAETVASSGLRESVELLALQWDVGKGGKRLSPERRQLLVLARALVKKPYILLVDEALSAIPAAERCQIVSRLIQAFHERILIWIEPDMMEEIAFTRHLEMRNGHLYDLAGIGKLLPEQEKPVVTETGLSAEVERLRRIPLFSRLNRQALQLLAFSSETAHFTIGETVFHQGDNGNEAYVVLRGMGEIRLENDGEATQTLNEVRENALVGEMALLGDADTHRSASFCAVTELLCLVISREVFVELVQQNPTVAIQINRLLVKRLQDTLHLIGH